jgi:hypothetical protein
LDNTLRHAKENVNANFLVRKLFIRKQHAVLSPTMLKHNASRLTYSILYHTCALHGQYTNYSSINMKHVGMERTVSNPLLGIILTN